MPNSEIFSYLVLAPGTLKVGKSEIIWQLVLASGIVDAELEPICLTLALGTLKMAKSEIIWQIIPASGSVDTKLEPPCLGLDLGIVG